MRNRYLVILLPVILLYAAGCSNRKMEVKTSESVRQLVDTVGFARFPWQMDSLMARLDRKGWKRPEGEPWKMAICPHDDYTYVGNLYPEVLSNIKAPNLILIGVAHKAALLGISDSMVFDAHTFWKGPWKNVRVSPVREELFHSLRGKYAIVSDTLQNVEHSLESLIPFLQYFNRDVSIVPIIVPAMTPERMQECGSALAAAIRSVAEKHGWIWGKDYAIVVTTDAVHYGNEDWGGADRAYYGCDNAGNIKARAHEAEIMNKCLAGPVGPENFRLFSNYTLKPDNYREYKWTWCGRYCIPVALYTSYYLNGEKEITGEVVGYSTSITSEHIPVDDLRMGRTAIATDCHWVGYAAVGFR
jgi:MEMO1 family protein